MTTPRHRRLGPALCAVVVASALAVASPPPSAADPVAEKKAEAERLAEDLEEQGRRVSVLAERLNQARLEAAEVEARVGAAEAELADADRRLAGVRDRLRDRAVSSYVGGQLLPLEHLLGSGSANDVVVRRAYVDTVAGQERAEITSLDQAQEDRRARRARLEAARASARVVLDSVATEQRAAEEAASARRATLAKVQGEVAALVEAETRRRAEEEARRVQAELAARQARDEAARSAAAAARAAATRQAEEPARRTTSTVVVLSRIPLGRAPDPAPDADDGAPPAAGAAAAVAEARRQLGKPYVYGASGPDSFDCSGLTAWAWTAGGRTLPHSSQAQYGATRRVSVTDVAPGDLLFYGSPIHHVGIYAGDGMMVEASETGTPVRMASIYRRDLVGVGRVG